MNKRKYLIGFIVAIIFFIVFFGSAFYLRNKNIKGYAEAKKYLETEEYFEAVKAFDKLGNFKDSLELMEYAKEGKEKQKKYQAAINSYEQGNIEKAINELSEIEGFKDSKELLMEYRYSLAQEYYTQGNIEEAINELSEIEEFKDSAEILIEYKYALAQKFYEQDDLESANKYFRELGDYSDSEYYSSVIELKLAENAKIKAYNKAKKLYKSNQYANALDLFIELNDYKDSVDYVKKCKLQLKRLNLNNVLAAGVRNSVAIKKNGKVVVAGTNENGQKKTNHFEHIISIDTYGYFVAGLIDNGRVVFSGVHPNEQPDVSQWKKIIDVATGENFIVGLDKNGKVYADGHGNSGQLKVKKWENVVAIDAGWSFTVALTKNKKLLYAGADNGQQKQFKKEAEKWKKVVNISASGGGPHEKQRGKGHTVGLCSDGTVVAIGDNARGQCNVDNWRDIVKIATGDWYTVGLDKYGKVYITGENFLRSKYIEKDILEKCTNIVDIAAGFGQTLCLKKDGTIIAFGFDNDGKLDKVDKWKNIRVDEIY